MKILAIDTSTEACSAALLISSETTTEDVADVSNDTKVFSKYQLAPREHSRLILKMIDQLLAQENLSVSSLDAIAFGQGPGSFMGLRIAAGVVQGIAFAHDIPVIPVSTLKAIAQRAYEETGNKNVLATIDARMDEVYWAAYTLEGQQWQLIGEESVVAPEKVIFPEQTTQSNEGWIAAGNGWLSYKDRLLEAAGSLFTVSSPTFLPDCLPSAEVIAKLAVEELRQGNTVTAAQAIPVYIRNNVAKKPKPVTL